MNRRGFFTGLWGLPLSKLSAWPVRHTQDRNDAKTANTESKPRLEPSRPVVSRRDGQIIENLDIVALSGPAIEVLHRGVTIRNCRIRHTAGPGIQGENAVDLVLQNLEIARVVQIESDVRPRHACNNIDLNHCDNATLRRIRASRGSSNIYIR